MKISKIRMQEIAGIDVPLDEYLNDENVTEVRAFSLPELEKTVMEMLHTLGITNPTNDQVNDAVGYLQKLIQTTGAGTVLSPNVGM